MKSKLCAWLCMIAVLSVQILNPVSGFMTIGEADAAETSIVYNAADYGVDGSDMDADTEAIQALLDLAKGTAETIEIDIPAGTYYIDDVLYIYSDTKLILDEDAVMMRTDPRNIMLMGNIESGELEDYGGYTQISNVTIQGGTWDGNDEAGESYGQIIVIFHGEGITVSDLTIQNGSNHFLNLSGDSNVVVSNVTFANAYEYQGDDESFWIGQDSSERYTSNEALHLDYITEEGESTAYPIDGTVCQNVVITDCTFENVFAGIGAHQTYDDMTSTGITVQNCVFTNVANYCIDADGFTDLTATENEVSDCGGFVIGEKMEAVISDNTINITSETSVIYPKDSSDCTITDNEFNGGASCYVFLSETTAEISGNCFTEAAQYAVRVKDNSTANIKSNTFTDDMLLDINVDETSSVIISDNTMTGSGSNSIIISGGEAEITSNQIYDTGTAAISITDASDVSVSSNLIMNASGNGIYVVNSNDLVISDNIIQAATTNGLYFENSSATVSGCEFYDVGAAALRVAKSSDVTASDCGMYGSGTQEVYVDGGSYVELIESQLECAGNAYDCILYTGEGTTGLIQNNTVNEENGYTGASCVSISSDADVEIVGNTLCNSAGNVIVISSTILTAPIADNTISGGSNNGILVQNSTAVLDGNIISDVGNFGIYVNNSTADVINSEITNYTTNAISVTGTSSVVTISGNTIDGSGSSSHAISLNSCADGCVISENIITDPQANGIQVYEMSSTYVYGNTVTGAAGYGILLRTCKDSTVCSNIVDSSAKAGIYLYASCSSVTVCHNEATNNGTYGIVFVDSSDIVVTENMAVCNITEDIYSYNSTGEITNNFNGELGDVNLDGEIDYLDAMMVLRYDAELISLDDEQITLGDVNGDDAVDSLDAILILRYDADLIDSFV